MKRIYDSVIKFHSEDYDCDAEFKAEDCKNNVFTDGFRQQLDEFEMAMGEIKSITFTFK